MAETKTAQPGMFDGFVAFVKNNLVVVNAVVLASTTLVSLLDFFAPKINLFPRIVYGSTGIAALLILVAGSSPRVLLLLNRAAGTDRATKVQMLYRRPAWQFAVVILLLVTLFGFISLAKAEKGGELASNIEIVRRMQVAILGIQGETKEIRVGVESANLKLDRIAETVDPNNPADRCPDLDCAITDGASRAAIEKLIGKGQQLPQDFVLSGAMYHLIKNQSPARFTIVDIYFEHGKGASRFPYFANMSKKYPEQISDQVWKELKKAQATGQWEHRIATATYPAAFGMYAECARKTAGGFSFLQTAILAQDRDLYEHILKKGSLAREPIRCNWSTLDPSVKGTFSTDSQVLATSTFQ